jgi:rhodanese-related sulfurtransferase
MSVQTVTPVELSRAAKNGEAPEIIDVRTPAEFGEMHVEGARLVPLDQLNPKELLAGRAGAADAPLYVVCKSGSRAAKACEKFAAAGFDNVFSIEGGTVAWEKAGLPVTRGRKTISLERQVRIGAGLLVLLGILLGWLLHPVFFLLSAFVGGGLVFAGVTDWCGMGLLLSRMPWNQMDDGRSCGFSPRRADAVNRAS